MYKIFIKQNDKTIRRQASRSASEALEIFNEWSALRYDDPSAVFMTEKNIVKKEYRLDKDWEGERMLVDEQLPVRGRPKSESTLQAISLNLQPELIEQLDDLYPKLGFSDRSSMIRFIVMDYLRKM